MNIYYIIIIYVYCYVIIIYIIIIIYYNKIRILHIQNNTIILIYKKGVLPLVVVHEPYTVTHPSSSS